MAVMQSFKTKYTRYTALVKRTRRILCASAAGANGIRMLSRNLGIAVDSGGTLVARAVFVEALSKNGVLLDKDDEEAVMSVLDRTGDGVLDPADFIAALRQDLTPTKLTWVIRVWYTFKENPDGTVQIEDIVGAFNPAGHPAVVGGERSDNDVRAEFQESFNTTTNPDGVITRQEFEQYCSCVAGLCPDDYSFVTLVRGVWPAVNGVSNEQLRSIVKEQNFFDATFTAFQTALQKRTVNEVRQFVAEFDHLIHTVHRPSVMTTPLAVRQLSLALRGVDMERTFSLSRDAFTAALWSRQLYMKGNEDLLIVLDTKADGSVDYLLYLTMLLPRLPPPRLMMLERLWELFPKDVCGTVDIVALHERFQSKDGEEKDAFLTAWDVRRAIQRRVTLEELIEWYTPTSMAIQLDKDFDILLKRQWSLP